MVMLSFQDSVKLVNRYGIPYVQARIVTSKIDAVKAARKLGFPVVMKLASGRVLHKTDVGAVKLALGDAGSVESAFDCFTRDFPNEQVIIQKSVQGVEVIVGAKRDGQFGPTVIFGLGGIFVETLKDFSLRVAPVTIRDALEMVGETKASKVLSGVRGKGPVDIRKLAHIIVKVSRLMLANKDVRELDLNPVIVNERAAVVVDARVIA